MSEHIPVRCENCGRELLIRARNLGRIGTCKYCGYLFRAQLEGVFELPLKKQIQAESTEIVQHRTRIEEKGPLTCRSETTSTHENAEKLAALRAECQRFREETEILRSRLEAKPADAS